MKVLFATDGSDCSRRALDEGVRLLSLSGAEVVVMTVVAPTVVGVDPLGMVGAPQDAVHYERQREEARAALAEAKARLEGHGLSVRAFAREGDPAHEILAAAADFGADVVVVGSHGRNALERLMLGSVSDTVVRRYAGAVLVVRPA